MEVDVEPESCQLKNTIWDRYYTNTTALVWIGFVAYIAMVCLSTYYEYKSENKSKYFESIKCFSKTLF